MKKLLKLEKIVKKMPVIDLSIKMTALIFLVLSIIVSCDEHKLSKRYHEIYDVNVLGARPSIEKIISVNDGYRIVRLKSKVDFLVAPTRKGYQVIIISDEPITNNISHDIFSQISDQMR